MPARHKLEHFLDEYNQGREHRRRGRIPLFRSAAGRTSTLTATACVGLRNRALSRGRRDTRNAQAMAGHGSQRTTKLYDRDEILLDETQRVQSEVALVRSLKACDVGCAARSRKPEWLAG
jgi:hypothetical protein